MATIQERIEGAEAELLTLKDNLVAALDELNDTPDSEEALMKSDDLSTRVEKASDHLDSLRRAEKALAERAKPAVAAPSMVKHAGDKPVDGLMFKHAVAKIVGFVEKKDPRQVIEERYNGDMAIKATFDLTSKAAVAPADTTTAGWAAELVQTDVRGFIDTLKTTSVAAAVASKSQVLNFGGAHALTIPRRNALGASLTEPAWVGEGGVIPLTQFSFGSQTLNRYKLAAITTMTKEIAEQANPQIEGLLRNALSEAYSAVLDSALLSTAVAVAGIRPSGIRAGLAGAATGAGAAAGTTPGSAVRTDLQAMLGYFQTNRTGSRPVLIMNDQTRLSLSMSVSSLGDYMFRDEVATGRLLGMEIVSSANVPTGLVMMVDADAMAFGLDAPTFDVSDVATVTEANADATAPTQANTGAADAKGTVGQVPADLGQHVTQDGVARVAGAGYTARSLWQTYSLGIRMVAPTSWGILRPGSVAERTAVNW